jgi:signal transduction histidine kinase
MAKLRLKLALFNTLTKLIVSVLFLIALPYIIERINLRQVDQDLIRKREQVIDLILEIGIEPFISADSTDAFGSYNILKEEFISLERVAVGESLNFIEVSRRLIDEAVIEYRVLNYSLIIDDIPYRLEVGKSIGSILQSKRNITGVIVLFIFLIIIITLFADLQYTNRLLRPLDKITAKLQHVPDPSRFDSTPVRTTTSDFLRLDSALSDLMGQISDSFKKEKEITANISHELLTPVSVIRSKLENLLIRKDINAEIAEKVEESLKTLHRLQSLVNSLLLIARLESEQYLKEDSIVISSIIAEVVSEIIPVADDKGVAINSELTGDYRLEKANVDLIFSMFYNVIYNGVKNTKSGGEVKIFGMPADIGYTVTVTDNGAGLSKAQLENLFLRFKSRTGAKQEGTGIGLAITKAIADSHQIKISVSSEEGSGTEFLFIFP